MPTVTRSSKGVGLRVQVVDGAGAVVDLTAADTVLVTVRTDRGARYELAATWPNGGNDGLVQVDLPDACWKLTTWVDWQIRADFGADRRYTTKGRIVVLAPV